MQQRVKWVDVVRCFGMFAIYLGHFGAQAGRAYAFVYTHHVPLFFLISGCLESASRDLDLFSYVKKVLKTIIVPWLLFAVAAMAFYLVAYRADADKMLELMEKILLGTVNDTYIAASLWFLTCLAVMKLLFWFIRRLRHPALILLVCFALYYIEIYVDIPRAYNLYRAFRFMPYFGIGYVAYGTILKVLERKERKWKGLLFITGVLALAYSVLLFFEINPTAFLLNLPYLKYLSPILNALVVIWLYILIAKICENVKLLNELGSHSLYLCGSEYFVKWAGIVGLGVLNLSFLMEIPIFVVAWSAVLLLAAYFLMAPWEEKLLHAVYRLPALVKKHQN